MAIRIPQSLLAATFDQFRRCGCGRNECQALWVGPAARPDAITEIVHPAHSASPVGFQVDPDWLAQLFLDLARRALAIHVQVHTHPGAAYHSMTDDAFPIMHAPGFLSLVIPSFAKGPVGFERAYLAQIGPSGQWREVSINQHLEIVQ